jgi:hypothetical protein
MTILKIELVEGDELLYKNPYDKGIDLALGANLVELKEKPRERGVILRYDESISYRIKPEVPVYILTLQAED